MNTWGASQAYDRGLSDHTADSDNRKISEITNVRNIDRLGGDSDSED